MLQFVTKLAARELIYKHPEMLLLDETKNEAIQTISPIETIIDRIVEKKCGSVPLIVKIVNRSDENVPEAVIWQTTEKSGEIH